MSTGKEKKKIDLMKELLLKNSRLFRCPSCEQELALSRSNSLYCAKGHNFDLARQGYVNLLLKQEKGGYDKQLYAARKVISDSGFFDPMRKAISKLIWEIGEEEDWSRASILDAGCGEGSHLAWICQDLKAKEKRFADLWGVGIDLSKEGIRAAAKAYPNLIWCVADLTKLPLQNEQFDIVLNILSPANYGEFKRVLKDHGVLLKILPTANYLIELREILFKGTDRELYENDSVKKLFANSFQLVKEQQIHYKVVLKEENLEHLIKMTPLTWNADQEKIRAIINSGLKSITVAFDLLVGKK
ncbi:MAG TPA: methyltransferase domain-containing protein [Firmicutes bacterium]|uniref:Methyltransferase domain-containing protein n=1 Tax=Capillibacterium thermochitinicola TaxID=2699427 RepID=A0A8J6HWT1_9FIRM|nr:methyltransferase domain-containing protein [Capillibacterium thermochitinicola]MBA2132747.1 methyltransferase domain-containing protein [Capillibacterium thermochitinicola]HHW12494.1 methyltransferase domain-containing protein [Bacillota bacterium]